MILAFQLVLGTLAAYALARQDFWGRDVAFALILAQLMIMPDALIVENYRTLARFELIDTIPAIALPYIASAFGIFLLRQTFKTVPKELDDAARVEGASPLQVLMKVYVPLAKPTYIAYGLVSVSYHWNNFLWPLLVTNSVESRPLTVGLQVFSSSDQGIDWAVICAATLMTPPRCSSVSCSSSASSCRASCAPASSDASKVPMKLITWNIQWARGTDDRVDPRRIIDHARAMADFDVLCLQEVAANFPDLDGNDETDQFALFAQMLPGFTAIEGIGVDVDDGGAGASASAT